MKTSGLDVHKDSIFCAIYDGKSYSVVKEFSTTTNSIRLLGAYLQSEKVKKVAMESTSQNTKFFISCQIVNHKTTSNLFILFENHFFYVNL